jgi:hypothetical protein
MGNFLKKKSVLIPINSPLFSHRMQDINKYKNKNTVISPDVLKTSSQIDVFILCKNI